MRFSFKKSFSSSSFFLLFALFLLLGIFFGVHTVQAQGDTFGVSSVGGLLPLGGEDIRVIIAKIIRIALGLLGIIAVSLMIYAGFTWMTAGGNEDKIGTAKKILINASIGLAIIMASFAITQFVLKSLGDATGANLGLDGNGGGRIAPPCADFADCQGKDPVRECADEGFVVKSLTPRTPQGNGTGMSDVVVRAVFSRPLDDNQNLNQIFILKQNNNDVRLKNVRILGDRQIVEAVYDKPTRLCVDGDNGCLSEGEYLVTVNPELKAGGVKLQTKLSCGDFDNTSKFTVNRDFLDNENPLFTSVTFNGKKASERVNVARGRIYRVNASVNDRRKGGDNVSFGGVSYVKLLVEGEPKDPAAARVRWNYYNGPKSGSNEQFTFSRDLALGGDFSVPALYKLTFEAADIDNNKSIATSSFILDGANCHNGRQDAGETGIDIGGECLGDGQCNADWQCIAGKCGENGQCVNLPVIKDVDVGGRDSGAWESAPGSWITLTGNYFGEEEGVVDFGIDDGNDGKVDVWIGAPLANCNGVDMWKDRMVIVAVPQLPPGTSTTIRITTAAGGARESAQDLSTDDRGPKPGPHEGYFLINNTDHPGLCAVLGENNTNVGAGAAPVTAFGRDLGNGNNSSLLFGGIASRIRQWGDQSILTNVPENIQSGRVGVRAKIGEELSNGIEFIVTGRDEDLTPRIESVSPFPTTTLESLITLTGARFGESGTVYLSQNKNDALDCAKPENATNGPVLAKCARLDLLNLPNACGNTWTDTQIIGKVPSQIALGSYFIVVKNNAGISSNGEKTITLVEGRPMPGLCRIIPEKGLSPLPRGADPLKLIGVNLNRGDDVILYYWTLLSSAETTDTWLNSEDYLDPQGEFSLRSVSADATEIQTTLPVNNQGVSMTTGPIRAKVGVNFSNDINYTVDDCTVGGTAPGENYQCCTEGPEKGLWKAPGFACIGQTQSAGYIWRFTTGLIPELPRVLEACNKDDWNNLGRENFSRPSPSPWKEWSTGDACINSVITLQFNMIMSPENLARNIRVYTCGNESSPNCKYNNETNVTANYTPVLFGAPQSILELRLVGEATHNPDTWYRIILGADLHANQAQVDKFGVNKTNTQKLSKQRPLNDTVDGLSSAYYFDFKTGRERCTLIGAAITPPEYTTRLLGVIQSPGDISSDIDNPINPLYYYLWGRGSQSCSVIDVNGLGWEWKPRVGEADDEGSAFAFATKFDNTAVPVTSTEYYKDIRAKVTALQDTLGRSVHITASTNTLEGEEIKTIRATSTLTINLGDPAIADWWPQCNESCINARIGVGFNRPMVTSTYNINENSAIRIEKCSGLGENCLSVDPNAILTDDVNTGAFDPMRYEVSVRGNLQVGQLYRVRVSDQILSVGRYLPNGGIVAGRALTSKEWKFRTKLQDGICILDRVDVVPNSFAASFVGQKNAFSASPLSAPDQCSPAGQRLNPWAYGWSWSVQNTQPGPVASVSHLIRKGDPEVFCTQNCLPAGSDIPLGETSYLCGNGEIDPGEDCDLASLPAGETPGVSCSLSCLRPGNPNKGPQGAGKCGNAALEPNVGEECDPGIEGMRPYCSDTCNWKGSSQEFSDKVDILQCGNGSVGLDATGRALLGEECDLGISLSEAVASQVAGGPARPSWSAVGCSQSCLHQGTKMSRSYCQNGNLTADQKNSPECRNATTICGDSMIESGEECEFLLNASGAFDKNHLLVFNAHNELEQIDVNDARDICSNRCTFKQACEVKDQVSQAYVCESGTPGCSDKCTLLGSSPLYDSPSICGDGAVAIGENQYCEGPGVANKVALGETPVQIVTALGRGPVDPVTHAQSTTIFAQAMKVRQSLENPPTELAAKNIKGQSAYSLQCGYKEYEEPLRDDSGILHANNCIHPSEGVSSNSCCQPRPYRVSSYPEHGAGTTGNDETKVCRNTALEAVFNTALDQTSLQNSVILAQAYPAGYNCASSSERNISGEVRDLLALGENSNPGFFGRVWFAVKEFFVDVFNSVVRAEGEEADENARLLGLMEGKVWCTGKIVPTLSLRPGSVGEGEPQENHALSLTIQNLLDENTLYAIVLKGGNKGIKDVDGVGIRGGGVRSREGEFHADDIFVFETGNQICKIDEVSVNPPFHLYTSANQSYQFVADVKSTTGQRIVSTVGYSWTFSWEPSTNSVFTFNEPHNAPQINISSKNVEGNLIASAQARITEDQSTEGNETGNIFAGLTDLTSLFCENVWPSTSTYPYEDGISLSVGRVRGRVNNDAYNGRFDGGAIAPIQINGNPEYLNFSLGYCADAGQQATSTDDLPFLRPVVQAQDLQEGTLKKFLFFNDKNDDVIGLQVFANQERLSPREWYLRQNFSGLENYKDIVIDGYEAITDGNNYYINALNELSDKRVHNNIYLLGINPNAQQNTRVVFDKLLKSLKFNINIPERNSCILGAAGNARRVPLDLANISVTTTTCQNDYDCRLPGGSPKPDTTGICANAKTKFQRDWERLNQIQEIQTQLEKYKATTGGYPALNSGTYIPGYTNTHWPSWSRLLEAIGNVSSLPLNTWSACGQCQNRVDNKIVACSTDSECGAAGGTCVLPDDLQTCWKSADTSFSCPALSNVLEYKTTGQNNYILHLPLEYFDASQVRQGEIIAQFVSTTHYSDISSCGVNGLQIMSPQAGTCGNGIVNVGEDCDPAGTSEQGGALACPQGQLSYRTCNASCHFDAPVCRAALTCGNGRVDKNVNPVEKCDDGALNGSYGHCNQQCSGPALAYCGNAVIDKDSNNKSLELCDKGAPEFNRQGYCEFNPSKWCGTSALNPDAHQDCGTSPRGVPEGRCLSVNDPSYDLTSGLLLACSNTCQQSGGYCGDGKLQASDEFCDDGNRNRLDGCSEFCQKENLACAREIPPQNITVEADASDANKPDSLVIINYDQSVPASCTNTTGRDICRGLGVECQSVAKERAPNSNGWNALDGGCSANLSSQLDARIRIHCDGFPLQQQGAEVALAGSCGNGIKDEGEACDTGRDKNGVMCSPEYGLSCTYCSSDCKEVLTRDATRMFGNGKIDIRTNDINSSDIEVCDIDPKTQQVVIADPEQTQFFAGYTNGEQLNGLFNAATIPFQCPSLANHISVGGAKCLNEGRVLDTSECAACGTYINGGKASPKISVLNVISPTSTPNSDWASLTSRKLYLNTTEENKSYLCGTDQGWVNTSVGLPKTVYSIREGENCNGANTKNVLNCIRVPNLTPPDGHRRYSSGVNATQYSEFQALCQDFAGFPRMRDYGYELVTNKGQAGFDPNNEATWRWGDYTENALGIESKPLCSNSYSLFFNEYSIRSNPNTSGYALNRDSGVKLETVSAMKKYGSFFPYLVNGEAREIQNELVVSPAIPDNHFRIVVKSDKKEGENVLFQGFLYNIENVLVDNPTLGSKKASVVSLSQALALNALARADFGGAGANAAPKNYACEKMEKRADGYWMPSACDPINNIFVSTLGSLTKTKAQALTVDTRGFSRDYAFFVAPVGNSELPISNFTQRDITVEIYDYRDGQVPEYSIFSPKPENVFHLRVAAASSNVNIAKYWHVFNLVKQNNKYVVQKVQDRATGREFPEGKIATGFADVLCNVPDEPVCARDE